MKKLIIFSLLLYCSLIYGQTEQEIHYVATTVEFLTIDTKTNSIVSAVPLGYKVLIIYNTFFKSYKVIYDGPDSTVITNYYVYAGTDSSGSSVYNLKDNSKMKFYFNTSSGTSSDTFYFTCINPANERLNYRINKVRINNVTLLSK